MTVNRIITRGMGPSRGKTGNAGLITRGYGGIFSRVVGAVTDAGRRVISTGRSAAKRVAEQLDEVIISMKLIRVNGEPAKQSVTGMLRIKFDSARSTVVNVVESFTVRVRAAWEDIKITVKRMK